MPRSRSPNRTPPSRRATKQQARMDARRHALLWDASLTRGGSGRPNRKRWYIEYLRDVRALYGLKPTPSSGTSPPPRRRTRRARFAALPESRKRSLRVKARKVPPLPSAIRGSARRQFLQVDRRNYSLNSTVTPRALALGRPSISTHRKVSSRRSRSGSNPPSGSPRRSSRRSGASRRSGSPRRRSAGRRNRSHSSPRSSRRARTYSR